MPFPPLELSQNWLIQRMKALNFKSSDAGVCCGVAHMGMQAILAEEVDRFDFRASLIASIPLESFAERIEFLQQSRINDPYNLSASEIVTLEIPIFFNGIELYQQAFEYSHLYSTQNPLIRQEAFNTIPYIAPVKLDTKISGQNSIVRIDAFTGIYDVNELVVFFDLMRLSVIVNKIEKPVVAVLCSCKHTITIGYDPKLKQWLFIDSNQMPTKYFDHSNSLAATVKGALSQNNVACFSTKIYSTVQDQEVIAQVVQSWKAMPQWQTMHTPNSKKIFLADSSNSTWLYMAATEGYLPEVRKLLAKLAETPKQLPGLSPLSTATYRQHHTVVKEILNQPWMPCNIMDLEFTPYFLYAINSQNVDIVKAYLSRNDLDVNAYTTFSVKPLYRAVELRNIPLIKALLQHASLDVNAYNINCETPLIRAVLNNDKSAVELLLLHKSIDPNKTMTYMTQTPLHLALQLSQFDIAELLLAHDDIKPELKTNGSNALHLCVEVGPLELMKEILDFDVNINIKNHYGMTPLFLAVVLKQIDKAKELLQRDANINLALIKTPNDLRHLGVSLNIANAMEQFIQVKLKARKTPLIAILPEEMALLLSDIPMYHLLLEKRLKLNDRWFSLFSKPEEPLMPPEVANKYPKVY